MKIQTVTLADLDRALEPYRGRTTLIHHFATWCDPCVDEMPEITRMLTSISPRDFHAIAISWELFMHPVDPREAETVCGAFLKGFNAPFDALWIYDGEPDGLFRAMRVTTGTVPYTEVRDARGERIAEFPRPILEPLEQERLLKLLGGTQRAPK